MVKVLILGGTGFVGRNLIEYLGKNRNYIITAPSSTALNLIDEVEVNNFLNNNYFDIIIHSAVYGNGIDKKKNPQKILEYNLRMYSNFEKNCDLFGKMYCLGSGAEFDKRFEIIDVMEESFGKSIPIDDYGYAKYIINKNIESSKNIYNLRLFGIFGKHEYWQSKFISNVCCKVIKDIPISIRQNVYFDYLWIDDFCGIMEWFINNNPHHHTYNIASGCKIDLVSLAKIVLNISNKNLPIYVCKEGLANEYTACNKRFLADVPEFKFTNIEQSIKELYLWYEKNEDIIDLYQLFYHDK